MCFLWVVSQIAAGSGLNSEYPAIYQSPQTDVEFWVGGRLVADGVPDYVAWDRPGDTAFKDLKPGSGNLQTGIQSGYELSLGRTLKGCSANFEYRDHKNTG